MSRRWLTGLALAAVGVLAAAVVLVQRTASESGGEVGPAPEVVCEFCARRYLFSPDQARAQDGFRPGWGYIKFSGQNGRGHKPGPAN
mgnify:CR=1 FL=1